MAKTKTKATRTNVKTKAKAKAKAEPKMYIVDQVLNAMKWGKTKWYLVKWMGYSTNENSWVKHCDIHKDLVNTPKVLSMLDKPSKKGKLSLKIDIDGDAELIKNIAEILAGMKYN
tara:strand:- start:240 stop:584 length:345 start_codon:yes stop_codon:yes gene_type:complete